MRKNTLKKVSETALNRFMDRIEDKYLGMNPIKKIISKYKFKKFCRDTMKASPSLGVLWYFADFIKNAERVYFYPNSKNSTLYSSKSYTHGENGFTIDDKDHNLHILVKLFSDDQTVRIQITRHNNLTTEHCFKNNSWTDDRQNYDEVLIDNVIGIINSHMVALLKYCWDLKGSFDNENVKV